MARRKVASGDADAVNVPSWLATGLTELGKAESAAKALAQMELASEVVDELQQCLTALEALDAAIKVGRTTGWLDVTVDAGSAITALAEIEAHGVTKSAATAVRGLAPLLDKLTFSTRTAWESHVRRTTGDVEDLLALSEVLAAVPALGPTAKDLKGELAALSRLSGALPGPASEKQLASSGKRIAEILGATGNASVREFLLSASTGSATLDQLNDEVMSWLRQHGATGLVRIRLGRSQ